MKLADRILLFLFRIAQAVDKPKPRPVIPAERHSCYGCRERFEGPGFLIGDRRYCRELCSPPFLRHKAVYHLAGDPGRG